MTNLLIFIKFWFWYQIREVEMATKILNSIESHQEPWNTYILGT